MCVINTLHPVLHKYLYTCIKKLKSDLLILRGDETVTVKTLFN